MENTIYVGKYRKKIEENGVIELPKSKLRILNKYITTSGKIDERVTIVVEDGTFWPYICKMEKKEVIALRDALDKIIESESEDQISEII